MDKPRETSSATGQPRELSLGRGLGGQRGALSPVRVMLRAHAKLNLALSVGAPLPASAGEKAGFHPIESWFACIDLHDDLEVERLPAGPSRFRVEWAPDAPRPTPIDWPIEKDLTVKAHAALERAVGAGVGSLPVAAVLRKRIPVGGGLGGGSSDAAAMLRALDTLFDLRLPTAALASIGASLGSDVPFFIDDCEPAGGTAPPPARPAIVSGLGERIERLPRVEGHVVLLLPPFGCPTGAVYRAFDSGGVMGGVGVGGPGRLEPGRAARVATAAIGGAAFEAIPFFNDLTDAACRVQPDLARLIDEARRLSGRPVVMTGSGSTLFVPEVSAEAARVAARRIPEALPNLVALPTATV
ncbi:MAG: hypothetical protein JNK35_07320 [Phycisphaerae bacterium]|nr:hypothetical protein [Phycisphaerae bacterium]